MIQESGHHYMVAKRQSVHLWSLSIAAALKKGEGRPHPSSLSVLLSSLTVCLETEGFLNRKVEDSNLRLQ